ncbi:hypothetical protein, partial [Catellatospora coxensis]|uniref:hypothetical protein n=1 Tax=Catellatospora coxensis TaxID=310354 RepID=UPI0031E43081
IEVDGYVFTEAKIKFVGGMSEFAIPGPPRRGSLRTYVVKAQCTRYLIDEKGEEPRLIIEMQHFVVYDRDQGPLNDRQRVETPSELEELDRKAKEGPVEETEVDENQPGLFGDAPDAGDEGDGDLPEGPEWGDAEANAQQPKGDGDTGRPSFSSIDGGQS